MNDTTARLGFGSMRLPETENGIDLPQVEKMVDEYMAAGLNYFDTAHGYHDGLSEPALRQALTARYPRESYVLTTKLSTEFFTAREEIRPLFFSQLKDLGVEYVDYYFHHALNADEYEKYTRLGAFEEVLRLREEGFVRHIGMSYHDGPGPLERILTDHPEIEVVQIQMNYLDWDSPSVQSRGVYEVCRAHARPVLVMEPCKGGDLIRLPGEEKALLAQAGLTPAEAALRFCASREGVIRVLSGMSDLSQLRDNLRFMTAPEPLTPAQEEACRQVAAMLAARGTIGCTRCRYCASVCPQKIPIPEIFSCVNTYTLFGGWNPGCYYAALSRGHAPQDCLRCGRCEAACPQHLPIRELLQSAAETFCGEEG